MINKRCFFWLLAMDLILLLLYWYYQPLCEPSLNTQNCPPCLSKNQYFIIYFALSINLLLGIYCLHKGRMKK
jgi:uncharacterized membrane protein